MNIIYNSSENNSAWNLIVSSGLLDFVDRLEDRFDTIINSYSSLSGGEIQKIGIARAIYKMTDIILLDEVTSNLDASSERVVNSIIDILKKDHVIIVIAHRLSTIVNAEKIYFIENGYLTGFGTHDELYHKHKLYRKFVDDQSLN